MTNSFLFGRACRMRGEWTVPELERVLRQARTNAQLAASVPVEYALNVLTDAGRLFSRGSPLRRQALTHLRETIPFSRPVIESTLDMLPLLLDKAELQKRMSLELFLPQALEGFVRREAYAGTVKAVPRGVVLHVGAGNIFLGIVDSLILGLLTKNVNIVKVASSGSRFPVLFAHALSSCDRKGLLCKAVAILSWKGGRTELEEAALKACDAAFIWGGDEAVASYKRLAPPKVHVVGFGAKVSLAVVSKSSLRAEPLEALAQRTAFDAARWDQSACSSPHTAYLLGARFKQVERFAELLASAFAKLQRTSPQGDLSDDEKVEITKARELAKVDAAIGMASVRSSFPAPYWTVIVEKSPALRISPLNRVLYLKSLDSAEALDGVLRPYKGLIQTVGFAGPLKERQAVASLLAPLGVGRVTELGKMLSSETGSPHDGTFPMRELVSWVAVEGGPSREDRLCALVRFAQERSAYYRRRLKAFGEVGALEDFERLPLLAKDDLLRHSPPGSRAMFTGPIESGVYFASGGSTGEPKYIFYDSAEYEAVCRSLGRAMEAGGLGPGDVAANLFVPGNLWSSFLSVEKALSHTRAVSVPLGSSMEVGTILGYLEEFKASALIGLPSFLLKIAEAALKGTVRLPVRRIFFGGESVTPAMARCFAKAFPGVLLRSAAYATVDAGVVGFQCERSAPGVHHLCADDQFLEILAKPGDVGEIVTTPLNKRHMPLLRLRLGDLGRWLGSRCPCGREEPLFELLGRCDDRIHAGGAHVFVSDIHDAASGVRGLSLDFQVIVAKKGPNDQLKIRIEAAADVPQAERAKLADLFRAGLRRRCEDLAASLARGWLEEPEIEVLPPGAIERIARTGKLRRVVDAR
ncbi:MAG: hypothetical protein HY922_11805 [Elusimicrobia bacterium]|nr:hypothetical protein [Elusimicrobiota bacterium]